MKIKKAMYVFLILIIILSGCAGTEEPKEMENTGNTENQTENNADEAIADTVDIIGNENPAGEYWQIIPMVSQRLRDRGIAGGEGGQWSLSVVCDPVEGSFLLHGTDIGGIYRSINGGISWEASNTGINARGAKLPAYGFTPSREKPMSADSVSAGLKSSRLLIP